MVYIVCVIKINFSVISCVLSDFYAMGGIIYHFRVKSVLKRLKIGFMGYKFVYSVYDVGIDLVF